ncbi:dihydroorotate dehydrogenase B catalytic subunit [Candidatus Gottesmanbacteria bacterium RIFCSPLOWO2_01_FULL_39_12b]|uniref:Dihydroorotate dehydrogenase n=1 Tax=Candidatus Gottesmanbacteria bacterium RIFCSPLOWO2_01_FULL_39_12b TaxID=1798388 RepID=A0A1F6AQ48_9BACT|nr:MAG: dihydroorotate dehydrogenase B catalytic subunit [Candidatus Gottesmanbacteria bacterium RIFCSPLOWO2_01_FULL_39_12b]
MYDLSVKFCGVGFGNPFILPSGIITEIPEHKKAIEAGVGGVTLKSLTYERREGNPLPRIWKYDCGMINSVGLRNAGIEKGSQEIAKFLSEHKEIPIIVSLFATKIKEFLYLVEKIVPLNPSFIELNLSCPNVDDEFGKSLGMEKGAAGEIVKSVKKISGKVPILAKLSPNVNDIADIARSCEEAGVDGIVAINTVGPGMIIDINKKKPVLGAKKGGVSGPGILPVTVRCVYEIYEAVKIPIIGMGGITKWQDVVEAMMAGATLVGVGTASYSKGMKVYEDLKLGLQAYMGKEGIKNLKELVGAGHKN